MKKLIIIQPAIAPYRVDFINSLCYTFKTEILVYQKNLNGQSFNLSWIHSMLYQRPILLLERYSIKRFNMPKNYITLFKKFMPDYILSTECNSYTILALLYKLLFNRKCKVISVIDDNYEMVLGRSGLTMKHKFAVNIIGYLLDNIICVEPRVENVFQHKFRKGVYFPIIYDDKRLREVYKKILPISNAYIEKYSLVGKKVFLFVGRLAPEKNVQSAIKAFLDINNPNTVFVIVGSGPEENVIRNKYSFSERIIVTGRLEGDELYAWYNVAQIFILPSIFEPFGAVTSEALVAGCYSLVSSVAGSQCLIENGKNGQLINPNSRSDIKEKMIMAINVVSGLKSKLELKQSYMPDCYNNYFNKMTNRIFGIASI